MRRSPGKFGLVRRQDIGQRGIRAGQYTAQRDQRAILRRKFRGRPRELRKRRRSTSSGLMPRRKKRKGEAYDFDSSAALASPETGLNRRQRLVHDRQELLGEFHARALVGRFSDVLHDAREIHLVERPRIAKLPADVGRRFPINRVVGIRLVPRPEDANDLPPGGIFLRERVRVEISFLLAFEDEGLLRILVGPLLEA